MNTEATLLGLSIAAKDKRFSVICDCRGVDGPEYLMYQGCDDPGQAPPSVRVEYGARCANQARALRLSDAIFVDSDAMRREFAREWNIPTEKMGVYPCCTDIDAGAGAAHVRLAIRRKLGLADRLVVAYCGNVQPWQRLPHSLRLFRQLMELRSDAHFLALTTNPTVMKQAVEGAGIGPERSTILNLPHADVPAHLAAADVGVLLRDASVVNRVAAPTKFAEYLSCGVPVVITDGIGDYSALVRGAQLGCVLPDLDNNERSRQLLEHFVKELDARGQQIRDRCLAMAKLRFGWDGAIADLCRTYEYLSRGSRKIGN
jgi:glycosyltransferase involved in cell wall biosynthesis